MAQPVYRLRHNAYTVAIIYSLTKKVMTRFIQALVMLSIVALFAGCEAATEEVDTPVVEDSTMPVVEEPVVPADEVVLPADDAAATEEPATTEVAE